MRKAGNRASIKRQELILKAYEALNERSMRMLDSARQEDWMALVQEESRYVVDVERLSRLEEESALVGVYLARKTLLLEGILERDKEVRQLLMARREALDKLLGRTQEEGRSPEGKVIEASQAFGRGGGRHDSEGLP